MSTQLGPNQASQLSAGPPGPIRGHVRVRFAGTGGSDLHTIRGGGGAFSKQDIWVISKPKNELH